MKIILIELDLWCSITTHQLILIPTSDFFSLSEVVITWQIDSTVHKLKPRSFYKFVYLWANFADFHLQCEPCLTNILINSSVIEIIIKNINIFNNMTLTFKPWVIKALSKLDIVIIWVDIWDIQSRSKTKLLINRCFSIGNLIVIVQGANINLDVSQCKNC